MPSPHLLLTLLLTISFTVATQLSLWREQSTPDQTRADGVLEALMGDSQRLFASHFVVKADVYLHSGYYPSIFDQAQPGKKSHLAEAAEAVPTSEKGGPAHPPARHEAAVEDTDDDDHDAAAGFLGAPKDWIDAFGRNFYPTNHTHLQKVDEREILPWLRLAASLNPHQPDTYTMAAYWLRQRMGRVKEAEDFLREGWRANPHSAEILFELGRLNEENKHDAFRGRNLYEAALRNWQASEASGGKPDPLTFMQITGRLARLEERQGNYSKAVAYLELLATKSPHPETIQAQIDDLKANQARRQRP
jgi:tetratricopeptide (TPR) repeat protein